MFGGFWEVQDELPPPPASSAVFVMRNGRYEPQNLMPVLPRPDILDFDGFVMRRGASAGYRHARPPEMRQAALLSNPVSVRRDSARATEATNAGSGAAVVLNFTFDAMKPGTLSLLLFAREVETATTSPGGSIERTIELHAQPPEGATEEGGPAEPLVLDTRAFAPGLGQGYESAPLDLSRWPAEALAFDSDRPKDIPLVVRLSADTGEELCLHYTYFSLVQALPRSDGSPRLQPWSTHIFAQKLQYGGQCFVLHEVFGGNSKNLDAEGECGGADCVICLSAPRDTAVLPCRHMCFCSYCAGIVRLQCDRCPVCRQKVASLLQFRRDYEPSAVAGAGGAAAAAAAAAPAPLLPASTAAPAAAPVVRVA